MTNSALSTITGQFQRRLVLGTLTPVVLFLTAGVIFVGPLLPFWNVGIHTLRSADTIEFIMLVFLVLALTGGLYNLNTPIVRFLEGYSWLDSRIGHARLRRHLGRFDALQNRWFVLLEYADQARTGLSATEVDHFNRRFRNLGARINKDYPRQRGSVLPTRLGNVIRSFENYSDHHYGIAGVTLWPRLLGVIDRRYADGIDEAQTGFDFMVNCAVLGGLVSLGLLLTMLLFPAYWYVPRAVLRIAALTTTFAVVSWLAYLAAIEQAYSWGDAVKGAYDLYRRDLLRQLGYTWSPASHEEQWRVWDAILRRMIYGKTDRVVHPPYEGRIYAEAAPADVGLTFTRTAAKGTDDGVRVKLRRTSTDDALRAAKDVGVR